MDKISEFIHSNEYSFVPMTIFLTFIIIASLIGFWSGWKTTIYFLVWNIIGLIPAIFLVKIVSEYSVKIDLNGIDVKYIINKYGAYLIMFFILLIVNFIALLTYLIFRSKLKYRIKENKLIGKSNLSARLSGATIGVITVLPMTAFMVTTTSILSEESLIVKLSNNLIKLYTIGNYEGIADEDKEEIKQIIDLVDNQEVIDNVADILSSNPKSINSKTKGELQQLLNNNLLLNSIKPEFIREQIPDDLDLDTNLNKVINSPDLGENKLKMTENSWNKVKEIISGLDESIDKDKIEQFMNKVFSK